MKPAAFKTFGIALALSLVLAVVCPSLAAQDTSALDDSTQILILNEIELTPTGVIAYDSAGNTWSYDFERDRFVEGNLNVGGETGQSDVRYDEEVVEPAEVRCTERKVVSYPALKAVYVGRDEFVEGDIVAYSRVTIKGWVQGSVQSFHRPVLVTATGRVDGNIRAPEIEVVDGGLVLGEEIITGAMPISVDEIANQFSAAGLWIVFGFTIAFVVIAFLLITLAPGKLDHMTSCANGYPVRCYLVGFLFVILMPVIVTLVALTVIGLLVVWLVPIAYLVAFAVGLCAFGRLAMLPLLARTTRMVVTPVWASILGIVAFMALWGLISILLGAAGPDESGLQAFSILLLVLSIVFSTYPLFNGVGAAVLTRFGRRRYIRHTEGPDHGEGSVPAPAPPPIPQVPSSIPKVAPRDLPQIPRPPSSRSDHNTD